MKLNDNDNVDVKSDKEEGVHDKRSVTKWQFDNKSSCFNNNYPEINYKDNVNNAQEMAPEERMTLTNVLQKIAQNLSLLCLHPDGKNGLHEQWNVKCIDQNYFIRRILNTVKTRFGNNPA